MRLACRRFAGPMFNSSSMRPSLGVWGISRPPFVRTALSSSTTTRSPASPSRQRSPSSIPSPRSALYVGLVTDTGSFRYSNTTPHAHRLAAALIQAGADPEALYRPLFATLSPAELATLQAALSSVRRDAEIGLTWAAVDAETSRRLGALDEYEGVIEHLRNLAGTEIAVLFRELPDGGVKVSFRSTGSANVAVLARSFGGGGHEKAAGATLTGALAETVERVLAAARETLGGQCSPDT